MKQTLKTTNKNLYIKHNFKVIALRRTRRGTAERGTITSGVTGLAHFSLQDHLLFSQGEIVNWIEESHRCHQGNTALLVHTLLIYQHHTEGIEWDSQQPELQSYSWRHNLCFYPSDEYGECAYQLYHRDGSEIQSTLRLLQPVEEVSGCGCGHSEDFLFLIKLTQKCNCCSDTHIDVHGFCSIQRLPAFLSSWPFLHLQSQQDRSSKSLILLTSASIIFLSGSPSSNFNIMLDSLHP